MYKVVKGLMLWVFEGAWAPPRCFSLVKGTPIGNYRKRATDGMTRATEGMTRATEGMTRATEGMTRAIGGNCLCNIHEVSGQHVIGHRHGDLSCLLEFNHTCQVVYILFKTHTNFEPVLTIIMYHISQQRYINPDKAADTMINHGIQYTV